MICKHTSFYARSALASGLIAILLNTAATGAWASGINATAIDRSGAKMADVVIYATQLGGTPATETAAPETVTITQEQLQFTPYVTSIRVGTAIKFPNNDKIEHHVKSFSSPKEFELKVYDKGTPPPVVFDKPGVVVVYCMFHGWMRAYVMVLDTPHFAKTDAVGTINLDKLKEGSYEVRAWHPDMGTIKPALMQTVKIGAGATQSLVFNFDFIAKKRRPAKVVAKENNHEHSAAGDRKQ